MTTLTRQKPSQVVTEKKREASKNNINKAREKRLADKAKQKQLRELYGISSDDEEASEEDTDLEEESVIFKAVQKKTQLSEVEALRKEIETLKATKRKPRQKKVVFCESTPTSQAPVGYPSGAPKGRELSEPQILTTESQILTPESQILTDAFAVSQRDRRGTKGGGDRRATPLVPLGNGGKGGNAGNGGNGGKGKEILSVQDRVNLILKLTGKS